MSPADWALLGLVALGLLLALRAIRQGKTGGCGGRCADCPSKKRGCPLHKDEPGFRP